MDLNKFYNVQFGFLVNDTCIIVAEVCVNDLGLLDQNHQPLLVDFKGLCKIQKEYVEVLEQSCSKHPSLIESHRKRKRSERFNECSFTALGELLHFLETKKVRDMMSHDACKELQDLWDEVDMRFDYDLSWLEPRVKSALTYFEKATKVEELHRNVADLEEKLKILKALKAKEITMIVDLETTKKELAKENEGARSEGFNKCQVHRTINNFSNLTSDKVSSETFFTGPYPWWIVVYPKRFCIKLGKFMVLHLYASDIVNFPVGRRSANIKLSLVNQLESKSTIVEGRSGVPAPRLESDRVFRFHDPQNGFLVKDTCIIAAEVSVNDLGLLDHMYNHPSSFMDFKGLCKIEKEYVEVLEESCSKHPSLIECHINRSQRFNECSFTILGKLLLFLKTKKVKDMMNHDACKELKDLWDEVEIRFDDLSWLEPHVKSALTYFEKAAKVEKLKTLKETAIAMDADLETTKKELAKAEEEECCFCKFTTEIEGLIGTVQRRIMKDQEVITKVKFTWTINNFSKLTLGEERYSWRIGFCPNWPSSPSSSESGIHTSVCLFSVDSDFPVEGRSANFKLSVLNQLDSKSTKINDRENVLLTDDEFFYSLAFIHLDLEPQDGFLVNDTCIIVAEVSVTDIGLLDRNDPRSLGDFKGLCKIEKEYVEVLEESCSKHSSLIECHRNRKRSKRFNECSFTALGKLLHFLKTKKVKDMKSHDDCKELQDLWDEVEIRFDDLSWLEPHVKSALTYFDKAGKVEKLKGDVADLEENVKNLKARAIAMDADLESRKKELAKAEEGFVERDLDDQLGSRVP
ncbi:hypothetical protein PIB30_020584 [Stylosanthes scabra]|uniref:MATH domain-containing protein n=1 Tax=Stylosanthes scabra TaxID=79078 RepID=A0ABU6Q8F8_9FABA|nr:hypothetical protein [Stylosanthes scabra]